MRILLWDHISEHLCFLDAPHVHNVFTRHVFLRSKETTTIQLSNSFLWGQTQLIIIQFIKKDETEDKTVFALLLSGFVKSSVNTPRCIATSHGSVPHS